jgi:hypothetical protein
MFPRREDAIRAFCTGECVLLQAAPFYVGATIGPPLGIAIAQPNLQLAG